MARDMTPVERLSSDMAERRLREEARLRKELEDTCVLL